MKSKIVTMQYNNVFSDWLSRRKISQAVIEEFGIRFDFHETIGECIVIPVKDETGIFSFNKYRRNPLDDRKPKYLYDKGGRLTLYGEWKAKAEKAILITEGEMDCLVAWSYNIPSVSGTGGAMSFDKEWAKLFEGKDTYICFDNDQAGGDGMSRVLSIIPTAKIVFIPDRPGVKDISDYVTSGGDLHELLKTAKSFDGLQSVKEHRSERIAHWQSTFFHDAYVKEHEKPAPAKREHARTSTDKVIRAKEYPIDEIIDFKMGKAKCLWHNEKSASMHYYKESNRTHCFGCGKSADAIDVYRQLNSCSFTEAVEKLQ